ncbi:MAG: molybdenum cofactor guanylyltransferase [Candidatus Zixiibacteriota bacterium]
MPFADCTGIVLAGGLSTRWGCSKADVTWRGQTLLSHVVERLRTVSSEVIAVARREQQTSHWPVDRVVHDDPTLPAGPLRGIVGGLGACRTSLAFVLSCDTPGVHPALLMALRDRLTPGGLGVMAEWDDRIQPLVALYAIAARRPLEDSLRRGEQSPTRALATLPLRILSASECRDVDPLGLSFMNLNTPGDLARLESTLVSASDGAVHSVG